MSRTVAMFKLFQRDYRFGTEALKGLREASGL